MFFLKDSSFFDAEEVNNILKRNPLSLISRYERLFSNELSLIAENIISERVKLVMLTGPSSSGKTTTSHKLVEALREAGSDAVVVSLDNFYKDRDDIPDGRDGKKDFESIDALATDVLEEKLAGLAAGETVLMPRFDFQTAKRIDNDHELKLGENKIAILEGIHALNFKVLELLPEGSFTTMYISAHADFRKDGKTVLQKSDIRFLRRMVRDRATRNADADLTFSLWDMVMRGEELYINPNRARAKIRVSTTFPYDPAALREGALPLLATIAPSSPYYEKATALSEALLRFEPLDLSLLPSNALIREFVGGSKYYD